MEGRGAEGVDGRGGRAPDGAVAGARLRVAGMGREPAGQDEGRHSQKGAEPRDQAQGQAVDEGAAAAPLRLPEGRGRRVLSLGGDSCDAVVVSPDGLISEYYYCPNCGKEVVE